jgi:CheY-like chemotaxis protein
MVTVSGVTEFQAKDVLLIDMSDPEVDVREFCSEARLRP